jgi:hypothetical protein
MYGTTNLSAYPPEYTFQCIALDEVTSSLSSHTYDGLKEPTTYTHNLGVQWQLDVQSSSGLHEWIDNATFSVWAPSQ